MDMVLSSYYVFTSMDYMYNACSTTARRGALDWAKVFEETNLPVFEKLYQSVRDGTETRRSLEFNGRSTYREDLAKELKEIDEQEIWRAGQCFLVCFLSGRVADDCFFLLFCAHIGKVVRSLRPDNQE